MGACTLIALAAGACAIPLLATSPALQPDPASAPTRREGDRARDAGRGRGLDKDALKKRLEQRLVEMQDIEKRMKDAIGALDRGETPDQVRKLFPEQGRWRFLFEEGWREGPPGGEPGEGREPGERGPEGRGGPDGRPDGPPGADDSPGGGRGERFRRDGNRQFTDADREAIREILTHAAPEILSTLDQLMEKDPASGRQKLVEVFPRMRGMLELRERDPKMYHLRLDDLSLARQSLPIAKEILAQREKGVAADNPDLASKVTQLRALMAKQFENRLSGMRHEIEMLDKRKTDRQKAIDDMASEREARIDQLMEGLINRSNKPGAEKDLLGPGGPRERREPSGGEDGPGRGQRPPK